ncbi:MAG: hypothetical protein M1330_00960 [Armatimonadetes bacterium]|nr:hypothetical protein [Armatimonadota bacterium]
MIQKRVIQSAFSVLFISLFISTGCKHQTNYAARPNYDGISPIAVSRTQNRLNDLIREAVLRDMLSRYAYKFPKSSTYFVLISSNQSGRPKTVPVTSRFLREFARHHPPVQAYSPEFVGPGAHMSVIDQETGRIAVIFHISPYMKWIGKNEAEVRAGYYCNDKNDLHAVFRVKKIRDKWTIEGAPQVIISQKQPLSGT